MKILITGGTGFIGFHLAKKLLEQKAIVHILDNSLKNEDDFKKLFNEAGSNIHLINKDLLKNENLDLIDTDYTHLVHLAAILGVQNVIDHPYKTLSQNIKLLENAIQIGRKQKCLESFIFASTSEVYAGTLEAGSLIIPSPENSEIIIPDLNKPRTSYMLSKIYGEALCFQSKLPVIVIRPHNIYGPRMGLRHVIPQLLDKVYHTKDQSINVSSTDHSRTFCYIDDAIEMIIILMSSRKAIGKAINIGNQEPEILIGDLAKKIILSIGKNLSVSSADPTEGSPVRRAPNMQLCYSITNYKSQTSLEEGIEKTFKWYLENDFYKRNLSDKSL
jgi:nucleoside-diphosphate-sugar epimerase